jgi:hypothetical protein
MNSIESLAKLTGAVVAVFLIVAYRSITDSRHAYILLTLAIFTDISTFYRRVDIISASFADATVRLW